MAATAAAPQRACPARWLILAAFASRTNTSPQESQLWARTVGPLGMRVRAYSRCSPNEYTPD
jgi:hypothetical protein